MKRLIFRLILVLSLFTKTIFAQIHNGDFSNWALDSLSRWDPVYWTSTNIVDSGTVLRDSDRTGATGYSVKLTDVYDTTQGYYESGSITLDHQSFSNSIRPSVLTGYWKIFNPHSGDQIFVEVDLFNSSNTRIGGGNCGTAISASIPNWTAFSDPLTYTTNDPVDNYSILIYYFGLSHDTAANCHLDDLAFDVSTVGIPELQNQIFCLINKSTDEYKLDIDKKISGNLNINIIDAKGNIVYKPFDGIIASGKQSIDFNLSFLPTGFYFCSIEAEDHRQVFRIFR